MELSKRTKKAEESREDADYLLTSSSNCIFLGGFTRKVGLGFETRARSFLRGGGPRPPMGKLDVSLIFRNRQLCQSCEGREGVGGVGRRGNESSRTIPNYLLPQVTRCGASTFSFCPTATRFTKELGSERCRQTAPDAKIPF